MTDDNIFDSTNLIEGIGTINYIATHIPNGSLTLKYYGVEETFYFTIEKGNLQLNVSDVAILHGNLLVSASKKVSGIVYVNINNKDYSSNMVDGKAIIPITDLTLGRYLATISFESDAYDVVAFNSYVTIKSSIDADNLTKTQGSETKFQATFYDYDGIALNNTKVTFVLNGGLQTTTTDNNGIISLDINLNTGTYEITLLNPVTDETKINTIIIESSSPQPIDDKDMDVPALPNTVGESVTVKLPNDATGTITLSINGEDYTFDVVNGEANVNVPDLVNGVYSYTITYSGDGKYSSFIKTGNVTVNKIFPIIYASAITTVYNGGKYLIVKLKDIDGNAINGVKLTVVLNGKTYTPITDANGQVKVSTNGLAPKIYTASITFAGNNNYANSTASAKVTVTKATPKITAKAKTFKRTVKTKKYSITLKTNQNKVMKSTKVYIKVNKKTYAAKTNSRGVATFKITKLTKKGRYTAVVTYKGNAYYNKLTKKVKITVK